MTGLRLELSVRKILAGPTAKYAGERWTGGLECPLGRNKLLLTLPAELEDFPRPGKNGESFDSWMARRSRQAAETLLETCRATPLETPKKSYLVYGWTSEQSCVLGLISGQMSGPQSLEEFSTQYLAAQEEQAADRVQSFFTRAGVVGNPGVVIRHLLFHYSR